MRQRRTSDFCKVSNYLHAEYNQNWRGALCEEMTEKITFTYTINFI